MKRAITPLLRIAGCLKAGRGAWAAARRGWTLFLFLFALSQMEAMAQAVPPEGTDLSGVVFEEVPVRVMVDGYQMFYIDAVYGNNQLLYVNIQDLFNTLHIPCVSGQKGNQLSGFIERENRAYSIDYDLQQLMVEGNTIPAKNGLLKETGALYMETSLFARAFGITLTFNYRTLTLLLKSNFELPVQKQMRMDKLHTNSSKIKGEVVADTTVRRSYHLMRLGAVDWSLGSAQQWEERADHRFRLGLGTELLYGEADVSVDYYSNYEFDNRQLHYLWRWVDNDRKVIRQAQVGKISNQTISFIHSPIVGAVVRNSPTTVRKASGYYTIHETTEPNWIVELYINQVLVDLTRADASGWYQFKVPMVYGYTTLMLKFYGPLGEERTEERTMNVPYNVMPAGEFEYGLSGGVVQDSSQSRFGKAEFSYGVHRMLTMGGGLEYLSSIPNGPYIPYLKATFLPFGKMILNAEYAHGVKSRAMVHYYFKKDVLLEMDYARYVEGQLATFFNAPEERSVKLSVPLRYKKATGFTRFDFSQRIYKTFRYNQGNLLFSAYYQQFSANASTQVNWMGQLPAFVLSDLVLSYRTNKGITLRPSAQYNVGEGHWVTCKLALEKYIPRGNLSVSLERNALYKDIFMQVNFRYDLPFARTQLSVARSKGNMTTSQSAQGSLAFGASHATHVSKNSSVSKGGICLHPFLDENHNGHFDAGEHRVKISAVSIMGGTPQYSEKDSIVRIPDLNAFTHYLVELKDQDLENISWRLKKKVYRVLIDPNQFKRIDVPVVPVGEVSGMAYLDRDHELKGIRRILVKFHEKNSNRVVGETLSEPDGTIYYLGLGPGEYVARVDSLQLRNLEATVEPMQIPFTIKTAAEGDIVSGLDFVLQTQEADSPDSQKTADTSMDDQAGDEKQPLQGLDEKAPSGFFPSLAGQVMVVRDTTAHLVGGTLYKVQLLALPSPIRNKEYFTPLQAVVPGLTVEESLGEDMLYHYSTGAFRSYTEARKLERMIRASGWPDCFVAIYYKGKRAEELYRLKRQNTKGEGRK